MRSTIRKCRWITAMFLIAPFLHLSAQTIRISATLDSTNYPVGDWIRIQLSAEHSYNTKMLWNRPALIHSGHFEKLSESQIDSIQQNDFLTENRLITVTSFDTGVLQIPSITCYFVKEGITDSINTNPLSVYITSVAVDTSKTARPIKQLYEFPPAKDKKWWYIIPFFSLLIIVGAGWYFFLQKRKPYQVTEQPHQDKRLPHEKANDRLHDLEKYKPWEHNLLKEFYVEITQILREYIEAGLDLPALENTTHEIISSLRKKNLDENLLKQLYEELYQADLVKFAKAKPASEAPLRILTTVKEFIDQTKPSPVQEEYKA